MAVQEAEHQWPPDLPPGASFRLTDELPPPWLDWDEPPEPGPLPPDPLGPHPVPPDGQPSWPPDEGPGDAAPAAVTSEWLAQMAPGLELASELEYIDPATADEYQLVEMIAAYNRVAAWSQSNMTHLAGVLSRRAALNPQSPLPGSASTLNVCAEEIAPRLGISRFAARRMIDAARAFRLKLEDTAAALHQGLIDYPKACVILRLLGDQPDDVAWEVQQLVLPNATHQTVTQLEKAIAQAIIAVDPHRATARARKARASRRVDHPRVLPDGMASMFAILPATDAAGLDLALEAAARTAKASGDTRTLDQLRADALALLGHGALEQGFIGVRDAAGAGQAVAAESEGDRGAGVQTSTSGDPGDASARAPQDAVGRGPDDAVADDADDAARDEARDSADQPPTFHTGNSFLRTPHMPIGTIGGQRAQVHVTIPLSVLIPPELLRHPQGPDAEVRGDSCAHCGKSTGQSPTSTEPVDLPEDWYPGPTPAEVAELEGYGPITPDVARALALSAETWRRLITDPLSGQLLDVGRTRYRPPAAIAEFVRLRDRSCVSPTCSTPARSCQLDHVEPWHFGGVTSAENLGSECARDHQVKTTGAFQLEHLGAGTFVWTTPSGHRYRRDHTGRITLLSRSGPDLGDQPPF